MKKIVSGILLLLMTLPALAEEAIQAAPKIDTDPTALIICAVLFVGMIGGFFAYIAWKDRRDQGKSTD
jgi:ABC-type nitrate/sulfonate/bicarbonate transport system substrate-binding protein